MKHHLKPTIEAELKGLKLKRKRKRIKPRPRDVTYKRGLDSDSLNMGGGMAERASTLEEPPSLNAQFQQIQPSRELLEFIEENCLGRRCLGVWHDRGYDPKWTAALDDLPDGKTKRNPIQETVGLSVSKFYLESSLSLLRKRFWLL
ncbi:unnamed protein product [Calypogeia fissa]